MEQYIGEKIKWINDKETLSLTLVIFLSSGFLGSNSFLNITFLTLLGFTYFHVPGTGTQAGEIYCLL
jgi:hypothetical protein